MVLTPARPPLDTPQPDVPDTGALPVPRAAPAAQTYDEPAAAWPESSAAHRLTASITTTLTHARRWVTRRETSGAVTLHVRVRLSDTQWVALLAAALSIGYYLWYAQQGMTLAYGDSIGHMMIARHVLVGRHTGLAQFGSVWPPFMHILMLPLVWNDTLYRSGFAGALPSMVAYVLSAIYMLRLGRLAFDSRTAGWMAALVLMLNPNVLYMQGTPMTEMGLICAAVIAIYYAVAWAHDGSAADLVKCAAAIAAGTLIRYDGWALALALTLIIGLIAWRRHGWLYAESHLLLFGTLAFAGCVAWLAYNRIIFGNWLEFYNGPYSSKTQQSTANAVTQVPTLGNPVVSFTTYGFATLDSASVLLTAAALLGLVAWMVHTRFHLRTLPILATVVPFFFNWLSLVKGTSIIETPEILSRGIYTYYNERYGLMMLPAIALFVAWLSLRSRPSLAALLMLVLSFAVSDGILTTPYALQDPLHVNGPSRTAVGNWLHTHCQNGVTLVSAATLSPEIFSAQLPDTAFVTEGDGADYYQALEHPEKTVSCVAMLSTSGGYDPVWNRLHDRQDWRDYFVLRAVIGSVELYQRIDTPSAQAGGSAQEATAAIPANRLATLSPSVPFDRRANLTKGGAARVIARRDEQL